jgi:peptidylprolyl isomerase
MRTSARFSIGLLAVLASASAIAQETWRVLEPENTLVIDTNRGRLILEMRPDMAPKSVERVKLLTREKVYDGLQFHRVIANFVAQTGNPNNRDNGRTAHPNLAPEMMFKQKLSSGEVVASNSSDSVSGFLGSVPFQATPITEHIKNTKGSLRAWGAFCPGVAGMGRDDALDSANSEVFFMLDSTRRMDRDYTVIGRIVVGMDVLKSINIGEPPAMPDIMKSVRVLADFAAATRPKVSVMAGTALRVEIEKIRQQKGADFSVCDVVIPSKVE